MRLILTLSKCSWSPDNKHTRFRLSNFLQLCALMRQGKCKVLLFWIGLLIAVLVNSAEAQSLLGRYYFASPNGRAENFGTPDSPLSLQAAFLTARENDTVWIGPGIYNGAQLEVHESKTAFIGYSEFPGDLSKPWPDSSINLKNWVAPPYPILLGDGRSIGGTAIAVNEQVHQASISNLLIDNYNVGLMIAGDQHQVSNVVLRQLGDIQAYYNGKGVAVRGHKNILTNLVVINAAAEGIAVSGDSNLVSNCRVYCTDTLANGETDYYIYITAHRDTKKAQGNIIERCYIERTPRKLPHVGHAGHGFCLTLTYSHKKCDTVPGFCYDASLRDYLVSGNTIRQCEAQNIREAVLLRGPGVRNNKIEEVTTVNYGGFALVGAAFNNFERCRASSTYLWADSLTSAIIRLPAVNFLSTYFGDSTAFGIADPETNSFPWETRGAHHNRFANCLFNEVATAVTFNSHHELKYPAYHPKSGEAIDRSLSKPFTDNEFVNCTFTAKSTVKVPRKSDGPTLFQAMRANSGNRFTNCIVSGFSLFESRNFASSRTTETNLFHSLIPVQPEFVNCLFFNNKFDQNIPSNGLVSRPPDSLYVGIGAEPRPVGGYIRCLVADPLWVDPISGNYQLMPNSPAIDKGVKIRDMFDFARNKRICGPLPDIGALEHRNCKD